VGNPGPWLHGGVKEGASTYFQAALHSQPPSPGTTRLLPRSLPKQHLGVCEALLLLGEGEKIQLRAPTALICGLKQARLPTPPGEAGTGSPQRPAHALPGRRRAWGQRRGGHRCLEVTGTGPASPCSSPAFIPALSLSPVERDPCWTAQDGQNGRERERGVQASAAAPPTSPRRLRSARFM